ncbi:hypothetical protein DM860_012175 [Cuscuta australis]|uniref:Uncharacterized protein n=1 Tax=Cuscuta australis TaxID=267555 RepID=A0A328E7L2_9ASTE|nr:hypothetical protein DM860_012175 [Cuscuta australis]
MPQLCCVFGYQIYVLGTHLFYTIISSICGFLLGAKERLGEIRSLDAVQKLFERFPAAFMDTLHVPLGISAASVFRKGLVEKTKPNGDLIFFKIYVIALSVYAGVHLFLSFLLQIPTCHRLTNQCDQWLLIRFVKWMHQEHYYVGRGMYERTSSFTNKHLETWNDLLKVRNEGRLFQKLKLPRDADLRAQVRRLYSLLTIKDSAHNMPRNLEARRRLEFFMNSLFMEMPVAKPVREMLSFK